MKVTAENFEELFGHTLEEAVRVDEELTGWTRRRRDPRICICGHGASRHIFDNGVWACVPSRLVCTCQGLRAVLETDDIRPFLRKSSGPGTRHALIRGMAAVLSQGKTAEWIEEPACEMCDKPQGSIVPVAFSFTGRVAYDEENMSGKHAFLCERCLGGLA